MSQKPNLIIVLLYIVLKKITTNALSHRTVYFRQAMFLRELGIGLGNRALRAQPTDYSLIC